MANSQMNWNCDPNFAPLIDTFQESAIQTQDCTIYGLWPDLTLAFLNSGWFQFASDNNGEPEISDSWNLGVCIRNALGPLESFYTNAFKTCMNSRTEWSHLYECSSPQTIRRYHMRVYPLGNGEGLLITNSLVINQNQKLGLQTMPIDAYRDSNGLAHTCAHCRRFRREDGSDQWDWIPNLVAKLPSRVSHGLCPICFDYHFPIPTGMGTQS